MTPVSSPAIAVVVRAVTNFNARGIHRAGVFTTGRRIALHVSETGETGLHLALAGVSTRHRPGKNTGVATSPVVQRGSLVVSKPLSSTPSQSLTSRSQTSRGGACPADVYDGSICAQSLPGLALALAYTIGAVALAGYPPPGVILIDEAVAVLV